MSSNTIEDLERLSLVSRIGRTIPVGQSTLRMRAVQDMAAGETLLLDPYSVNSEIVTVASVDNRDITLTAPVSYAHEVGVPVIRRKFGEFITFYDGLTNPSLSANVVATATQIVVTNHPAGMAANTHWVVIDPYTVECEVRKVTLVAGLTLTMAALAYNHSANDPVIITSNPVFDVKWFGAIGDGVTDDTVALQRCWDQLPVGTQSRGAISFAPMDIYLISDQLDWRDKSFITIYGNWASIRTQAGVDYSGKCLVNFGGSAYCTVENLELRAENYAVAPAAGLVLGRTLAGFHGGFFYGRHILVTGYFSFAAYYNVGSECSTFVSCNFENYVNGACGAFISNDDVQTLLGVSAGQLTGWYYGCIFHGFGAGSHSIKLRGYVADHAFFGCYAVPGLSGHVVHCEAGAGALKLITNCTLDSIRHEYAAGDNSDTRFLYNDVDVALTSFFIRSITWSNTGVAGDDPDYIYEFHGVINNLELHTLPNTFSKKTLLINSDCVLTNAKIWGDVGTSGVKQVTVEAGATLYRTVFYWPNGGYPFDATPAGMNLVQYLSDYVGNSVNAVNFVDGDTSPSVAGALTFNTANTGATLVIDFDDGYDGQEIFILVQDAVTTFDFSNFGGASNLSGNNGVDYAAALYDVIRAKNFGGTYWYCQIIQSKF